jgi:hypothetical protein
MLRQGKRTRSMLWLALVAATLPAKRAAAGEPAYVWLWYADGSAIPTDNSYCSDLKPPEFVCNYQATSGGPATTDPDECKRLVQGFLDKWYADFNLVFTLTRPSSRDYDTIVITGSWPQCQAEAADLTGGVAADEGGLAPGSCLNNPGQTALAIECGKSAHDCATIIAHEHGHLVGLVHTTNLMDIMYPSVRSTAAGFVDETMTIAQDASSACVAGKPTQNSYQQMLSGLGAWPGGTKPSLFAGAPDTAVDAPSPDAGAATDAPAGSSVGPNPTPSASDGSTVFVGGEDAWARPTIARADAAAAGAGSRGGCSLGPGTPPDPFSASVVLVMLLVAVQRRARY